MWNWSNWRGRGHRSCCAEITSRVDCVGEGKNICNEMLGQDEESIRKDSDMDSEGQDEQQVNVTVPTSDDHEELMRNFKSVAN